MTVTRSTTLVAAVAFVVGVILGAGAFRQQRRDFAQLERVVNQRLNEYSFTVPLAQADLKCADANALEMKIQRLDKQVKDARNAIQQQIDTLK